MTTKEYFSHDYGTRNKTLMAALLHEQKARGYGLFWIIVEMLHEGSIKWMAVDDMSFIAISKESGESVKYVREFVDKCINRYKVFMQEGDLFTTERVLRNIDKRLEIKEKKSKAGRASAAKRQQISTGVEHNATDVQHNSTKERKEKERKEKESNTGESNARGNLTGSNLYRKPNVPSWQLVAESFFRFGGTEEMAKSFFDKHESTGWFLNGSPITNWSALVGKFISTWRKNDELKSSKNGTGANKSGSGNRKTAGADEVADRLAEKLAARGTPNVGG